MHRQIAVLSVVVGALCFGSAGFAGPQVLEVSPTYLEFSAYEGGGNPAAQVLSIWNSGHAPMDWTVTPDCNWITVEPNSGTSSGEVDDANVIVNINGLVEGTYNCQLTVTGSGAPNSPQVVDVNLVIYQPVIELSAIEFEFYAFEGGANPANQILSISNIGTGTLNWGITEYCGWLSAEPNSGSSTGGVDDVNVIVDILGLTRGTYNCQLTVDAGTAANSPQIVDVKLVIYDPNLVSLWKFDEGSGTIAYDSAGDNDGTLNGDPNWTTGLIDGALDFDGSGDYVLVPDDDSLTPSSELTISSWVYINSISWSDRTAIVNKYDYDAGGGDRSYFLQLGKNQDPDVSSVCFQVSSTTSPFTGKVEVCGTTQLQAGQWYHVVVTHETDHEEVWINGVEEIDDTDPSIADSIANNNEPLYIGYHKDENTYFNGTIDDVRIYDRVLSGGEILQIYGEGLGGRAFGPNPADGATGVDPNVVLRWWSGKDANSHDVYFGTDFNDVNDANTLVDPNNVFMGNFDVNSFDPCGLEYGTKYYWRIDEVNEANDDVWKGNVWSFRTRFEPNLIAWWKFDEGSGTIATDSVGDNNGTIIGATWTTGQVGGALSFDGVDDYVDVGDPADGSLDFGTENFSISAWVKQSDLGTFGGVFSKTSVTNGLGYGLHIEDENRFYFRTGIAGWDKTAVTSNTSISTDTWYHVVGVREDTTLKIYVNGSLDNSTTGTLRDVDNTVSAVIGRFYGNFDGHYHNGTIDDVRIYDGALSAEEILQLCKEGFGGRAFSPNPGDGATGVELNVVLNWSPGVYAASHDVYFGTGFSDVNDATTGSAAYQGNLDVNSWDSNNYAPSGLEMGQIYYWRIDEVNAGDVNSPWKGNVWNFVPIPAWATNPSPTDGAENISPISVVLHWTPGPEAVTHDVYFGTDFNDVNDANTLVDPNNVFMGNQGPNTFDTNNYDANGLEYLTAYYWRIDEVNEANSDVWKGDIWYFSTSALDPYAGTCWDPLECVAQYAATPADANVTGLGGDSNCDGTVNFSDLGALKRCWATTKGVDPELCDLVTEDVYCCCTDFNHDGTINFTDLSILKAVWGNSGALPSTGNQDCPP
jgi:hypothetical protein